MTYKPELKYFLGVKEDELKRLRLWYKTDLDRVRAARERDGIAIKAQIAEIKRYLEEGGELDMPKCGNYYCFLRLSNTGRMSCYSVPAKCGWALKVDRLPIAALPSKEVL